MPQMLANIIEKLDLLEQKVDAFQPSTSKEEDCWMSVKDLCEYLPTHPAEQTVYGWTSNHLIPFYKNGKCIFFRKSEVDEWIVNMARKSVSGIKTEALAYVANNPRGGKGVNSKHG